jgi:hypothetical protein
MAAQPPPAVAPGNFGLGPGRTNNALDYSQDSAVKFYYKAILPLQVQFDGKPNMVIAFLAAVQDRSRNFGWDPILQIVVGTNTHNLIRDYGSVTLQEVQTFAGTYSGQQNNRSAQSAEMMYHCLMHSLTTAFKTEVLLHKASYHLNGNPDGPSLLKQIVNMTYIDNPGTISHIQQTLIAMPLKLAELGGNITQLNSWVLDQVQKLAALGQVATDLLLLPHLWNAYLSTPDVKFVTYIEQLQNQHEDGSQVRQYADLMLLADNNYKLRVQKGLWNKTNLPTGVDQSDIEALLAQFSNSLKKKTSAKKTDNKSKADKKKEAWKFVAPKPEGSKTKEKNDKTYHWCPNHDTAGMWTLHDPSNCRNTKHPNYQSQDTEEGHGNKDPTPAMGKTALAAIAEGFGDSEENSDDE